MMHRCSRSEIGSVSENSDKDIVFKKYQKYKQMSKDLITDNEELKQVIIFILKIQFLFYLHLITSY